jgi:hypothetical protein
MQARGHRQQPSTPAFLFTVTDAPRCHRVYVIHCDHADSATAPVALDCEVHTEAQTIAFLQEVHETTCTCARWLRREAVA